MREIDDKQCGPRVLLTDTVSMLYPGSRSGGDMVLSNRIMSGTGLEPTETYDPLPRFFRDTPHESHRVLYGINLTITDDTFLSLNDRLHHYARSARTKSLRTLGKLAAEVGLAKGTLTPMPQGAHLIAMVQYQTKYRVDPANALPTVKALVDGLVDANVFPDDDSRHVKGPDLRRLNGLAAVGAREIRLLLEPLEHCTCV